MDSQDRGFSQFLQQAASFVPASDSSSPSPHPHPHPQAGSGSGSGSASEGHGKKPPSAGEALSSAKIVFDAAMSKLHKAESEPGGSNPLDKAKVAAAAAAVLAAAKHYGKMEDKSYGKYVQQAEDYLNKFGHNTHDSTGNSHGNSSPPTAASHSSSGHEENNYGKYIKQAEGFLNKF